MSYGTQVTLEESFGPAVARVRAALAGQGFGVLTEIDVTATLKAKLGEQMEDYTILGACNPPFAYQALGVDRSIGMLLPCNIVVRASAAGTIVEALDPRVMVTLTERPELAPVADEVSRRLAAALAELAPGTASDDPRERRDSPPAPARPTAPRRPARYLYPLGYIGVLRHGSRPVRPDVGFKELAWKQTARRWPAWSGG